MKKEYEKTAQKHNGRCARLLARDHNNDQPATVRATKSRSVGSAEELVDPSARETLAQAQQADPEIGPLVRLRLTHDQAPLIDELSAESEVTKTLHAQWFRLQVKDGLVYRTYFAKSGEPERLQ
jgi:hypothetical protein